jgi:CRP-like cAMP-binding protein
MAPTNDVRSLEGNRLLAALPREEYERLLPQMEVVSLEFKQILYEMNQPIESVYFHRSGVTSLVALMEDGSVVELATVGNEGMVGLPVFLGAETTSIRALTQVPGEGVRMKAELLREEVRRDGALHDLLHRYTQALFHQIARGAACSRVHSVEQQCARWLLMTHDRVDADEFLLTQEFLSQMLGVRRASVNAVARILQKAGLIRYRRGKITILDRQGLEAASCECYRIISEEFTRLLG